MKVRKCSWPCSYVRKGDPKAQTLEEREDKEIRYIGNVMAVKVDELLEWCRANPDVTASALATSIENGAFE